MCFPQDLLERERCNQDAIEEERAGLMKLKEVILCVHHDMGGGDTHCVIVFIIMKCLCRFTGEE